ncbi:hypothetical protein RN001_016264 [Aquatica leii]|uniref:RING-type E3 ubiquitin transferase n=1 Tax=Aquatica leii TaxID=1421715 RepID=A0AAN7NU82_9COLE|nr:hypothetical protein RN001_016264 [Aquatica leii]
MALIEEMRKIIFEEINVDVNKQRLFYKGKQLNDDHRVMDYNIQLNDVIQLMVKQDEIVKELETTEELEPVKECDSDKENGPNNDVSEVATSTAQSVPTTSTTTDTHLKEINGLKEGRAISRFYTVGDAVDFMDLTYGAWFEGHVLGIFKVKTSDTNKKNKEPDIIFTVKMDNEQGDVTFDVTFDLIRPRSYYNYKVSELRVDQKILVNYNIEQPTTRGYWYDFIIKRVNSKQLKGTVLVGKENMQLEKCTVKYLDEVLRIEKPVLLDQRQADITLPPLRKNVYYCEKCKDVASKLCKECGCKICSGKDDVDLIILCDECDYGYHTKCLTPPLETVPEDPEWYCPSCKIDENEIVKAGDKLKFSNKKSKMASSNPRNSNRDWGRGMACVGRTKECTIVPKDHYGPIPGVEVGTRWKFRVQVSESGIHRPHVAGIHGRETDGAYSLVLSGGYDDDVDNGVEFIYSGSGGRDLSNNRRVNDQSSDQVLSRMNKALALNCNAPLNMEGAEATDWKGGKPVRVVRNSKLAKHSKYAPTEGNRYDGIYKVVKYYPEKGKSGYLVWKYLLRRDDPSPVPWSKDAEEFELIYPDGYTEAQAVKLKKDKKSSKRSQSPSSPPGHLKKKKAETFTLDEEIMELINNDTVNDKLWSVCKEMLENGRNAFFAKVEETFMCICCQEVVYLPVTTDCKHNICKSCLTRSFSAQIYSCPHCRFELGEKFAMTVNDNLSKVLIRLYPGYDVGR